MPVSALFTQPSVGAHSNFGSSLYPYPPACGRQWEPGS